RGSAEYMVEREGGSDKTQRSQFDQAKYPSSFRVAVHFDGSLIRWDFQHCRCFRDEQNDVVFDTYAMDSKPGSPGPYSSVFVYDKGRGQNSPFVCHPRYTGHGLECVSDARHTPRSLADVIRKARETPDINTLTALKEGTLIKVVNDMPSLRGRD